MKGNSENGYTVSMDYEKAVTSRADKNASAQNIDNLVKQRQTEARRLFKKEFPEAALT